MALQVWLPLTDNLNNQGLSNLTFSTISGNTTVNNSGKIGKCYANNSNTAGGIISNTAIDLGTKQSMFCWFKFSSLMSNSSLGGAMVTQHRYGSNSGMGLTIKYVSSTTGYLSINTGNGSSRTYNTYCGTTLLQADTWYHGGYTYDGSTIKIYVNGICELTQSYSGMYCPADYIAVFAWSLQGTSDIHSNYKLNGSINDVRIYDHCLSLKEVELISRGLVVHYPMNGGGKSGANLAKGSNTNSTSTNTFGFSEATGGSTRTIELVDGIYCAKITRNTTAHASWSYLWYSNWDRSALKTNTTYTLSFDIIGSGSGTIGFSGFMNGNATNNISASVSVIQNSFNADNWSHLVFRTTTISDFTDKGTGQTIYMSCPFLTGTETWIMMKNMHLEEGTKDTPWMPHTSDAAYTTMGYNNIEYDVSGNGNHGTRTNVTIISNSSRYSSASSFNGSSSRIFTQNIYLGNAWSYGIWFNSSVDPSRWQIVAILNNNGGDADTQLAFWIHISQNRFQNTANGQFNSQISYSYSDGNWHQFFGTYDGTSLKTYIDGNLVNTTTITAALLVRNNLTIGGRYNGSGFSDYFNGYLSDFRLYATVLTADQIKELYQSSASIDKNGNMYAYEYNEI